MFKWRLTDNDTSEILKLSKDPKGWEELTIKHERDAKWHGINYDFTSEFGFFCKGAGKELVDTAYLSKGQEANVSLTLDVKCNGSWTRLFTGKLNFSSYRQEWIANVLYSFLDVENDDIKKLLNVREDLNVNLLRTESLSGVPIPDYTYAPYEISMHSKVIKLISSWENTLTNGGCAPFTSNILTQVKISEWAKIKGELQESSEVPVSIEVGVGTGTNIQPIIEISDDYVFPFDITISWDIAGTYYDKSFLSVPGDCASGTPSGVSRGTSGVNLTLSLFKGSNAADLVTNTTRWDLVTINAYTHLSSVYADTFSQAGSITMTINRGEKLWLFWLMPYKALAGSPAFDIQWTFDYERATISAVADTTTPATVATGIAIHEAWSKLSAIITDQPVSFYSDFFGRTNSNIVYPADGCGSKTAITSGLNIRGFTNSEISTSLKDMFAACNSIWAIGLGIEDYANYRVLRAEPVHYFYQSSIILTLENVPNLKMTHLADRVYNKITIGFQKWQTENTNGLDEPNAKVEYAISDIKSSKNSLDFTSPYVGGMYAIEQTRRKNHLDFATEDTGYDENIFFICLNKDDLTIPEKNENFSTVTNLLSPETAYNLRLALYSTFNRLKYLFTSGLTKLGTLLDPVMMIQTGEGNGDMQYAFIPDGCDGDSFGSLQRNIRHGRYPDSFSRRENPLWLPEEFTFEYPISFEDYLTVVANPYGLIKFSDGNDNFYYGWITSLEYNVRQKSATFTIIRKFG